MMKNYWLLLIFVCIITKQGKTQIIKNVDTLVQKIAQQYQTYQNGKLDYKLYLKTRHYLDTFYYKVKLTYHKPNIKKTKTHVRLDIKAYERSAKGIEITRSHYGKRGYLLHQKTGSFSKERHKMFKLASKQIYSFIPAIDTPELFERLSKAKKTLTTTNSHYIISTQKAQFYIHQKTYQIDKMRYQSSGPEGDYYEYVEIEHQSYNQPEFENERLYRLEKPSNSQKLEKIKRSETLLPVGTDAPAWTLANIETGDSLSLQDLKGKVIVLDFWYTSCPPCIEFLPKMKKLRQEFKNEEVVFIGMAYDKYAENIVQHLQKYAGGISYPNVLCSLAARKKYKVHAMPAFFVIDQAQKVSYARTGTLLTEEILRKQIKKCLKQ